MSRIAIPASIETSPAASQPLLEAVKKQLGSAPNLFRLLGVNPVALEGHLGLFGALGKGHVDLKTRQRIAIRVAENNGCDYCLSAHTFLGKNLAKLDDSELADNRTGHSSDAKADAALAFVDEVMKTRGHVSDAALAAVRAAGYNDGDVLEIVLHIALNTLTNYVNSVAATPIDFPVVKATAR